MASPIPIPRSDLVRIPSCGNGSSASSSSSPPGRPSASHSMLLKLDGSHRYTSISIMVAKNTLCTYGVRYFDFSKAFGYIERGVTSDVFFRKRPHT